MFKKTSFPQRIPLRQKAILILSGFFLCIVLLEIGLRLGGFIFLSFQEYRNRIAMQQKGTYRIMCLGESTTAGGSDSYPVQLEEVLNQRNIGIKFSIINRGVIATNTMHILNQLEDNLNRYKPDMVTTMMGMNDSKIIYYENIPDTQNLLFNKFRTYKLARILWMHAVNKTKEMGILKIKNIPFISLPDPPVELGHNLTGQTNSKQNEQALKKTIESNPNNEKAYFELGRFYIDEGRFSEAEQILKMAININPQDDEAYTELGRWYRYQGNGLKGEEMYKKALELNSRNEVAYTELGWYYRENNKLTQAEEILIKATVVDFRDHSAYFRVYFDLGEVYRKQGKFSQAEEVLKKAIELRPDDGGVYAALGCIYEEIGKNSLAQEYFSKADKLRLTYYNPITYQNYRRLKEILDNRGIKLVCVQYPMRSIEPLRRMFEAGESIIFVDNEKIFKEALKTARRSEYFSDNFGGEFGHCTRKGNRLLAENIANLILKDCFGK